MNPEALADLVAALVAEQVVSFSAAHLARIAVPRGEARRGATLVLPVDGMLMPRSYRSAFGTYLGMDALRARLDAAAADPNVRAVVLDIDSPGGAVAGAVETAARVAALAARKPVVAVANAIATSAAYWIACQASEMVMAPHALTGSIGVMAMHQNGARLMDRIGIATTIIASGSRKAEGNPFGPLTETAMAALQSRVNEAAVSFYADVSRGRRMSASAVRERFGDGRVIGAREAVSSGLADRIATLDQVVAELASGRLARSRSAASFDSASAVAKIWPRRSDSAFR